MKSTDSPLEKDHFCSWTTQC